jgi:hypothetical protein
MKEPIVITNLNDGIDVRSDPAAISEGGLADCVGFDLTHEGVIRTAGGLADNDISAFLPTGIIQCVRSYFIGSTRYILATTTLGLYSNSVLIRNNFFGRFKGVVFLNNIYMVNGTHAIRFDGTTCYQWGITAPTTVPTITPGTYLSKDVDTFESLATWTANQVACVVSAEAVIKKEGTQSAHFAVAASAIGYSFVPKVVNGTLFSTGAVCGDSDYLRFWLYTPALSNLESLSIFIDVGAGTFVNDYYSYSIVSPGTNTTIQTLGLGKTADVASEETVGSEYSETIIPSVEGISSYYIDPGTGSYSTFQISGTPGLTTKNYTTTISKTITKTVIDPIIMDQVLSFWRRSSLFELKSATWKEIKIPKSLFLQVGDATKTWATIAAIKIEVAATSLGTADVYIDGMKFVGGSDLVGDYWFMYSWGRTDGSGNMLHESAPARVAKQYTIVGPITFDRQPLTYTARPLSADPQVNCGILSAIGGSLTSFWEIAVISDNTTVTGTISDIGEKQASRILASRSNEPAPPGTDVMLFRNKIWMLGDSTYPGLLRSSDILIDGTLAPEGWPTRNAYEMAANTGALLNLKTVNKQAVIKGESGEWLLKVLDPTDYLRVAADKVSGLGLLGQDAVIAFETSNIYPSIGGFVESDGNQARYILPEVAPLIDTNIVSAIGVNAGLVSYFTYQSSIYGKRTAKVDLFRGKPRITNMNDILFDCLEYDEKTGTMYCVSNGGVYILDMGNTNEATIEKELYAFLKSRVYRRNGSTSWHRMSITHNTGGMWYRLEVYVDGKLIQSFPFISLSQTVGDFRFGPTAGYDFQFVITGNYTTPGSFSFPMRIW